MASREYIVIVTSGIFGDNRAERVRYDDEQDGITEQLDDEFMDSCSNWQALELKDAEALYESLGAALKAKARHIEVQQ